MNEYYLQCILSAILDLLIQSIPKRAKDQWNHARREHSLYLVLGPNKIYSFY